MITSLDQLDLNKRYTYADYLTWQFEERVELIRGRIFKMSPAPSSEHQRLSSSFHRVMSNFFHKKTCQVFAAPYDILLPLPPHKQSPEKVDTVVQPDLCVICDPTKIQAQGCNGAPDWIIEILSPSTSSKDLNEKFDLYQHAGVQEYWIVHPHEGTLIIYFLNEEGAYQLLRQRPYTAPEIVTSCVFSELNVELEEVF